MLNLPKLFRTPEEIASMQAQVEALTVAPIIRTHFTWGHAVVRHNPTGFEDRDYKTIEGTCIDVTGRTGKDVPSTSARGTETFRAADPAPSATLRTRAAATTDAVRYGNARR